MAKAQSSLEFLLVIAAGIMLLLLLLPSMNYAMKAIVFTMDVVSARDFASSLQAEVDQASFLSDGTKKQLIAKPVGEWRVSTRENVLSVSLFLDGEEKKVFQVFFPNTISMDLVAKEKTFFVVKKENGKVLIEYY